MIQRQSKPAMRSLLFLATMAAQQQATGFSTTTLRPIFSGMTEIQNQWSLSFVQKPSTLHMNLSPWNDNSMDTVDTASSSLMLAVGENDIGLENAFQDSISFTDGPIVGLVGVFVVFVVLAFGFKGVMEQMDSAIDQVLEEFETDVKRYYPKKWESIETKELEGLVGDERDVKLLKVMEKLQQDDPEFMVKLENRKTQEQSSM